MKRSIFLILLMLIPLFLQLTPHSLTIKNISQSLNITTVEPFGITASNGYIYVTTANGLLTLTPNLTIVNFTEINDPAIPLAVGNTVYVTTPINNVLYVIQNGKVIKNISLGSNFEIGYGSAPLLPRQYYGYGMAYDPINNMLYVADGITGYIDIVNLETDNVTYLYGYNLPTDIVTNQINDQFFVLDSQSFKISVIQNGNVIYRLQTVVPPTMGVMTNNYLLYLTSYMSNYVEIINLVDGSTTLLQVPGNPLFITYDPDNGNVYVSNFNSNTITVIQGTKIIGNYTIGSKPAGIIFYDGLLYVALYGDNKIVALNPNTMQVVYSLQLTITYSDAVFFENNIYVTEFYNNKIVEMKPNGTIINSITLYSNPLSIAEGNGYLYVTCPNSSKVLVLTQNLQIVNSYRVPTPFDVLFYDGNLYVTSFSTGKVYVFTPYDNYTIAVGKGPSYLTVYNNSVYVTDTLSNQISIINNLGVKNINLSFTPLGITVSNTYIYVVGKNVIEIFDQNFNLIKSYYFSETELPFQIYYFYKGVALDNFVYLPYGNYVGVFNNGNETFTYTLQTPISDLINVNNTLIAFSPLSEIYFIQLPNVSQKLSSFNVTVIEEGLKYGTLWGIRINGTLIVKYSNSSNITLALHQGIYNLSIITPLQYIPNISYEIVNLSKNLIILVNFTIAKYNITFLESGINQTWHIKINSTVYTIKSTTYSLQLPYGYYVIEIIPPAGYNSSPSLLRVNLDKNVVISITFIKLNETNTVNTTETMYTSTTAFNLTLTHSTSSASIYTSSIPVHYKEYMGLIAVLIIGIIVVIVILRK